MIPRFVGLCLVPLLVAQTSAAQPDEPTAAKQVAALQSHLQKTIEAAEPSIACVLVSRSDLYQKYGHDYSSYESGKLGGYNPKLIDEFLQKQGLPRDKRDEIVQQLDLADADNVPESFGSGVALDAKGLILTTCHIVQGATKIFVRMPGNKSSYADILAADPRSDLAILQLIDPALLLKPLPLGKGEAVKRGQFVISLANPFIAGVADAQPGASFGLVSNIHRAAHKGQALKEWHKNSHQFSALLQTDVKLHDGCSGGALLGLDGKLLGLITSLKALNGINAPGSLAMPVDATLRQVIDILRKGEEVEYAFLGVSFAPVKKPGSGAVLTHVIGGSPAHLHGLKPGDIVVSIDGQAVSGDDMLWRLAGLIAGTKAKLAVRKVGKKFDETVLVLLTKSHVAGKTVAANTRRPFFRGFRVDYSSLAVQCKYPGFDYENVPKGVLVTDVQPNSPAATALLKPGEIVTHVNNQLVETPDHFYQLVLALKGPIELTLISLHDQPAPKVTIN